MSNINQSMWIGYWMAKKGLDNSEKHNSYNNGVYSLHQNNVDNTIETEQRKEPKLYKRHLVIRPFKEGNIVIGYYVYDSITNKYLNISREETYKIKDTIKNGTVDSTGLIHMKY